MYFVSLSYGCMCAATFVCNDDKLVLSYIQIYRIRYIMHYQDS